MPRISPRSNGSNPTRLRRAYAPRSDFALIILGADKPRENWRVLEFNDNRTVRVEAHHATVNNIAVYDDVRSGCVCGGHA